VSGTGLISSGHLKSTISPTSSMLQRFRACCAVAFTQKYGDRLRPGQRKTLDAMLACRRVRDYGFLHANARLILKRVQLLLHVDLPEKKPEKTPLSCNRCMGPLKIVMVLAEKIPMQFRFYATPT